MQTIARLLYVPGSRVESLNHLRVSAALLVFGSHVWWSQESQREFFGQGFVGVSIFFVLSGFVMSFAYADRISNGAISFATFVALRLARLAPLYWAMGLVYLIVVPFVKSESVELKAGDSLYFFFIQSWIPNSEIYFSLNPPSWSISTELFFYLAFFPLVLLASRRIIPLFISLLALVFFSAVAWTVFARDLDPIWGNSTFSHWLFYIFPVFRALEFIVGILIHRIWTTGLRFRFLRPGFVYLLLGVTMVFGSAVPEAFRMSLYYLPAAALLVYSHAQTEKPTQNKLLAATLRELGNASYSFYMIHFIVLHHISFSGLNFVGPDAKNLLISAVIFSAAILVHRSFERPLQSILNKIIDRR